MNKVITIYDAKTNLSKLVKQAKAGKTIYIGSYGNAEAIIAPVPTQADRQIGVWNHKKQIDYDQLAASDSDIATWLEGDE